MAKEKQPKHWRGQVNVEDLRGMLSDEEVTECFDPHTGKAETDPEVLVSCNEVIRDEALVFVEVQNQAGQLLLLPAVELEWTAPIRELGRSSSPGRLVLRVLSCDELYQHLRKE